MVYHLANKRESLVYAPSHYGGASED